MNDRNAIRSTLRGATLIALAAFGLHQLRYLIGYGDGSSTALSQQGHGYMATLLPELLGVATVVIAATFVAAVLSPRSAGPVRPARLSWTICSAGLFAIFVLQESVEGLLSPGHPAGLGFLTTGRGWIALPLALAFGALVVFALRLLCKADSAIVERFAQPAKRPRAPRKLNLPPFYAPVAAASCTLAFGFARRPPPLAS